MMFGSVCSGIEAASIAWEPLGWTPAWFAEIEPFPSAVLANHWPHIANLGDMTKIADRITSGEISAPDVLVGGTPCQAFSVAGARKGLADDRGFLTIKYVELADAIDETRTAAGDVPCITVWENVRGVLSSKDNAFGAFLGLLSGEECELLPPGKRWPNAGCVYGPNRAIAWRVLDAQYFGVAQQRLRVFVVASAREGFDPSEILHEQKGLCGSDQKGRRKKQNTSIDIEFPSAVCGGELTLLRQDLDVDCTGTITAGFGKTGAPEVDAYTCIPWVKEVTPGVYEKAVRRLTPTECERLQGFPDNHTLIPWAVYKKAMRKAEAGMPIMATDSEVLAARIAALYEPGLRDQSTEDCPDGPRYKAIGNSMNIGSMRFIGKRIDLHLSGIDLQAVDEGVA